MNVFQNNWFNNRGRLKVPGTPKERSSQSNKASQDIRFKLQLSELMLTAFHGRP